MNDTEARFWAKVDKSGDCWLWTGATTAAGWHGRFAVEGRRPARFVMAHRYSWELAYGPIPAGLGVLHACDTPTCVRPNHLMLGSHRANMIDAGRKGRMGTGKNATHCKRGHAFADNTYIHPGTGRRMCHRCHLERSERWRQKNRAA